MKRKRRGAVLLLSLNPCSCRSIPVCCTRDIGLTSVRLWMTTTRIGTIRMLWSYNTPYLVYGFRLVSFSFAFIMRLFSSWNASITSLPLCSFSYQDYTFRQHSGPVHLHNLVLCRLLPTISPVSSLANFFRFIRFPSIFHAS